MSFAIAGFIMDMLVLVGLGATIYFAIRLSKNLNIIKSDKKELRELIAQLSKNIDQANASIINMRATATKSAHELQGLINQSRTLSEELQIMNEAGNSLAERLEKGAGNNHKSPASPPARPMPRAETQAPEPSRSPTFFIQDRDFGQEREAESWADVDGDAMPDNLQTQAERELYTALRKNQKKPPMSGRH